MNLFTITTEKPISTYVYFVVAFVAAFTAAFVAAFVVAFIEVGTILCMVVNRFAVYAVVVISVSVFMTHVTPCCFRTVYFIAVFAMVVIFMTVFTTIGTVFSCCIGTILLAAVGTNGIGAVYCVMLVVFTSFTPCSSFMPLSTAL